MPRTAFVTGASGFVGLNLVGELPAQGWRVLALHRAGSDIRYLQRMQATRALSCDCSKAMREPGFRAVPLREMVGDCVAWLAAEGLVAGVQSARPSQN